MSQPPVRRNGHGLPPALTKGSAEPPVQSPFGGSPPSPLPFTYPPVALRRVTVTVNEGTLPDRNSVPSMNVVGTAGFTGLIANRALRGEPCQIWIVPPA